MKSLVDAHMTGGWRGMVGRENVAAERRRDDDEHQHFLVVLNGLADDDLALKERETVLANVVAAGKVKAGDIGFRKGRRGRQAVKEKLGVGI
jgi:hypothetical protein